MTLGCEANNSELLPGNTGTSTISSNLSDTRILREVSYEEKKKESEVMIKFSYVKIHYLHELNNILKLNLVQMVVDQVVD